MRTTATSSSAAVTDSRPAQQRRRVSEPVYWPPKMLRLTHKQRFLNLKHFWYSIVSRLQFFLSSTWFWSREVSIAMTRPTSQCLFDEMTLEPHKECEGFLVQSFGTHLSAARFSAVRQKPRQKFKLKIGRNFQPTCDRRRHSLQSPRGPETPAARRWPDPCGVIRGRLNRLRVQLWLTIQA